MHPCASLLCSLLLALSPTVASKPADVIHAPIAVPSAASTTAELVRAAARQYGLGDVFFNTLQCESQGFQNIQSKVPNANGPGGYENSWGVAQIDLDYHPEVTRQEALNVEFSIRWAARAFAAGQAHLWACWAITGGR